MNNWQNNSKTSVQFVEISSQYEGQRLDNYLHRLFSNVPKSRIYTMIRKGEVRLDKHRVKPEEKLQAGQILRIPPVFMENKTEIYIPERYLDIIKNSVIYQDDDYLIINKPAGIAVHRGSEQNFSIIDIVRRIWGENFAELAHRLDKETSGVLVLGKNLQALREFQNHIDIQKKYLVLVDVWNENFKEINLNLLKKDEKVYVVKHGGQKAKTLFRIVRRYQNAVLLEAELFTGRTHQIRVSVQHKKAGVAGDKKYGNFAFNKFIRQLGFNGMFLHACEISFKFKNKIVKAQAELSSEQQNLLNNNNL